MPINPRSIGLLSIIGLALVGLSACDQAPNTITAPTVIDSATAAVVNGEAIYIRDVELEAVAQGMIVPGSDFGTSHPDFPQILDQLIDQRLLAQEAVRRGLDQQPEAARRLAAGRERLLGNILVESLVATEVTDDAIDRMYEEQVKLQQLDDEVRLRRIIVETEAEAANILEELNDGRDFAEAALEHSTDIRTRLEGGDLGWIKPNELGDPDAAIIGNTVTGNVSEVFQTETGWAILKVDERRTTPPKTKAEMRPEIITFMTFTQISDILRELRFSANIQQRDPIEILQEADAAEAETEGNDSEPPAPTDELETNE
ncbi:MAG: peptidylprolyl isomerase [Pseudomonadota bacterium]